MTDLTHPRQKRQPFGILLVNLGTPEAPTVAALKRYLGEFLWDPRVVDIPRPLWWLILHWAILRIRPRIAAKAYRSIWTERGSPLLYLTQDLGAALKDRLAAEGGRIQVEVAMRYGRPSIRTGLEALRQAGVGGIMILPLYPQYASATTGSVLDKIGEVLRSWRHIPEIYFVSDYHDEPAYVEAVAQSIRDFWQTRGRGEYLLLSFHGLPEKSRSQGDPYFEQCHRTARLIAQALQLKEERWKLVFQSRFGRAEWLKPYCVEALKAFPAQGIHQVDVVCPGFPVDCLETLEEIANTNRRIFLQAGGKAYRYIPALNAGSGHIEALVSLLDGRIDLYSIAGLPGSGKKERMKDFSELDIHFRNDHL